MAAMRVLSTVLFLVLSLAVIAQRLSDTMTGVFDEHVKSLQINFADDFLLRLWLCSAVATA